jgi:hypothetical protein
MKKYFLHDGNSAVGPFNLEELKAKKISRETLIWFDGNEDWIKAGSINELKPYLQLVPPPLKVPTKSPPSIQTNFSLEDYGERNGEKIRNIFKILSILFSIIYCVKNTYNDLREFVETGNYAPLTIRAVLNYFGGDWKLFVDWVYYPENFITINALSGWFFKIVLFIPAISIIFFIMERIYWFVMAGGFFVVYKVTELFGRNAGVFSIFIVSFLLLILYFYSL